ncbi:MAG: cadmium-translocating P-type ATPase [Lachnospiraceae bacterium]|nr:cadmium-translocating P-type ATPase [Lachnospiraceae bacterium]
MSKKLIKRRNKIIIAAVLFVMLLAAEHMKVFALIPGTEIVMGITPGMIIRALCYLGVYLEIGLDVIIKAAKNIRNGQIFDENFLMMIATFAAFAMGEYTEAVAVMLFYQIGELFQDYAVGKSRESITEMMSIAPEFANLEAEDGSISEEDPEDIEVDSVIVVRPGEKVPLDGVVIEGESFLDTTALTGESVPRRVCAGEDIISGCVNGEGTLRVRVTKAYEDSTVARILELVENASTRKARLENFITRFAKYYTPVVTIGAVLLAVIPPIVLLIIGHSPEWMMWIHRACVFLIVSCPCALVISVPLGFFGGIGAASKIGVLVKGSNYLELASELDSIVFDKTGTLTKGVFEVTHIFVAKKDIGENELLDIAAHMEGYSTHPIADSIVKAYKKDNDTLDMNMVSDINEVAGRGVTGKYQGRTYYVGNSIHLSENGITAEIKHEAGTVICIADESGLLGTIIISDTVKQGAAEAISRLKAAGITKTIMLTGDREAAAANVAADTGIDEYYSELLPADKVLRVEKIIAGESTNTNSDNSKASKVGFVGDGINDAPVLMRADVGFAMGSLGSDAAIEAADIVIMDDDIRKIASVIGISKKTMVIVKTNVIFAIGVKVLVLLLGALGLAGMWAAVFADVGVAFLAILNSMRALGFKE